MVTVTVTTVRPSTSVQWFAEANPTDHTALMAVVNASTNISSHTITVSTDNLTATAVSTFVDEPTRQAFIAELAANAGSAAYYADRNAYDATNGITTSVVIS